jgi:flagellin
MDARAGTDFSFQVGAATGPHNQIAVTIDSMNTSGLSLNSGADGITVVTAVTAKNAVTTFTPTKASFDNATSITTVGTGGNEITDRMATVTSDTTIVFTDSGNNATSITLLANDDTGNAALLNALSGVTAIVAPAANGGTHSEGDGIKLTFAEVTAADAVAAVAGVTAVAANTNRITVEATTTGAGDADTNARDSITLIDAAIKQVNTQRSELGAVSNRLNHTVNNLTNISSNLSAAKGGIEDADFALETTNLAKNQILQQASTAMLAQANASKQNVLSLLQG